MAAPGGGTPSTASSVQVPYSSHDDWVASDLGSPASDPANVALAAVCTEGAPLYRQHWYKYTATVATTLRAEQNAFYEIGRDSYPISSGVAVLTTARDVIDCDTGSGTQSAGSAVIAAGATVYIVGYVMNDNCPQCISDYASDFSIQTAGAAPANDDWQNAASVTTTPFTQTVDNRLATNQGADEVNLYFDCTADTAHSERTLWWTFTPAVSGPLTVSASGPPDDQASLAFATAASGGPKFLPGVPDQCSNKPASFTAGTTYLVQVGLFRNDHDQGGGAGEGGPITLSVKGPSNALAKPDLVVTGIVATPSSPQSGAPATFSARVKNQGHAATPKGTVVGVLFKIDGHAASWSDAFNGSLAPGGLVTLTANNGPAGVGTWSGPAGKHSLQAYVDDVNRIKGESNESNNTLTVPFTVAVGPAKPDLVVTAVTASPAQPAKGNPVTFSATIKNQGSAATPAGTISGVVFQVDGVAKSWSDTYTKSIPAGASVTLKANSGPSGAATWTSTAGAHTLQAVVDDVGRIAESNEGNNARKVPLGVGAVASRPDLVVTQVAWSPSSPAKGAPVRFSATVKNVGTRFTPDGIRLGVSFRINGAAAGSTYADTFTSKLAPGATVTLTANGGGSAGTWKPTASGPTKVVIIVDDVNRIAESDESNNDLAVSVTVG